MYIPNVFYTVLRVLLWQEHSPLRLKEEVEYLVLVMQIAVIDGRNCGPEMDQGGEGEEAVLLGQARIADADEVDTRMREVLA